MRFGLRIHPAADREIDEIVVFIARRDLQASYRFLDALTSTCSLIQDSPRAGAEFETTNPSARGTRRILVGGFRNYIMFYKIDTDMIMITHVLHGSRDIDSFFERETES